MGTDCRIFSGAVIGAPGYGYVRGPDGHRGLPHVGGVVIGDHVDVGACACIDSGTFAPTRIESHVKIDDLVMVAHNCSVGARTLLCGQVGLAGSVVLSEDVVLGGKSGVKDGVRVGKRTVVAASASVMGDVGETSVVAGVPAVDASKWRRAAVAFASIPDLRARVRQLEQQIAALQCPGSETEPPAPPAS